MAETEQQFSEAELIGQAQAGNNEALGQIFQNYSPLIVSRTRSQNIPGMEPNDIKQEVGVKLTKDGLRSYSPTKGSLSTWLSSITYHAITDAQRSANARPQLYGSRVIANQDGNSDEAEIMSDEPSLEEIATRNEKARQVRRAITQLPLPQRQAVYLAYFEEMSQTEIAQALGDPLGTVKTRIRLGLTKLRNMLIESGLDLAA